jgi:hypothetical protein
MANAPLSGRDGTGYKSDLGDCGTEIFLKTGLDAQNQKRSADLPDELFSTVVTCTDVDFSRQGRDDCT